MQPAVQQLLSLSGLEAMQAIASGKIPTPSIGATLNFKLVEAKEGFVAFEGEPTDGVLNPFGMVHDAWAMALLNSAASAAGHTVLPAGRRYATLETKTNFVRGVTLAVGRMRAEGRVISSSRLVIGTEAKLVDSAGHLLAHGTSTLLVLHPRLPEHVE